MKRILCTLLSIILVASLFAACGDESGSSDQSTTTTTTTSVTTTTQTTTTTKVDETTTTTIGDTTSALSGGDNADAPNQGSTTTTTTNKPTTTTTNKPTTTTTSKPTDSTTGARTDGVTYQTVTKTIYAYDVDPYTLEPGAKRNRQVTFKGTIKIGNTAATSGAYSAVGVPYNEGILAYINEVNFNGGIGGDYSKGVKGYYIEFIHYDDCFNASAASHYTKKLVQEDKVFALVGHFGSPTVGATIDYIKQQGVIACYMASGLDSLYSTNATTVAKGSTLFPVQPIYSTEGRIIVGRIVEQYPDAKKIGVIYTADEIGLGIKNGASDQIRAMGSGYECVLAETTTNASALSAAVAKLTDCDAVIVASTQNTVISILRTMIINGVYRPVFMSYSAASGQILTEIQSLYNALDDADKFPIYSNYWLSSVDMESYLNFAEDIIAYSGDIDLVANSYALAGWIAANVFCDGLERVIKSGNEINNLNFVKAMEKADVEIEMTSGGTINYSGGYRLGTTTMGLLVNNAYCGAFEEVDGMKDFIKFIKTGNVAYL